MPVSRRPCAARRERLAQVAVDPERPVLRVSLAGEIYMVLEPAVNFEVERFLGENGVAVDRQIYLSDWIRDQLLRNFISHRWQDPMRPWPALTSSISWAGTAWRAWPRRWMPG